MTSNTDSSVPSPQRRLIVAGLGAAGLATVCVGLMRRTAPPATTASPATAAAASAPTPAPVPAAKSPAAAAATPMSRDWFEPQLNTAFRMERGDLGSVNVKLIEVGPVKMIEDRARQQHYTSFSIVLESASPLIEESRTYRLEHPVLGKMDLFLSPIGKPKDRTRYEAVFTQRV